MGGLIMIDRTDPMSQFRSAPKNKGQIISAIPKRKQPEWHEQLVFCRKLKLLYPDLEFRSDLDSAGKKTLYMQNIIKILHSGSGYPDTKIFEPKNGYAGFMCEIKKIPKTQGESIYKVDGSFKASDHVENQIERHIKLRKKGWYVCFAEGADEAFSQFEAYYKCEVKRGFLY